MNYFLNIGLLMLYSVMAIVFTDSNLHTVLALLCAISLCCICYVTESGRLRTFFCLLYLAASVPVPVFAYFFPVVLYELLRDRRYPAVILVGVLYLYALFSPCALCFGVFGFLTAFLLQKYAFRYEQLADKYLRTQDDGRERDLLLTEKNRALLEKQNYEIYAATLRERNRIAREIHDNVGHVLSRSILMVGAIRTISREEALSPMLENLDASLNSAMDSIRSSVHDLHEDSINLKETVCSLIQDFTACPVELTYDMGYEVPREVKYCFISITREALSNVIRHSNATHVQIIMREHPALYQLSIADNGTPDPLYKADLAASHSGIGLVNMQDRVRMLNGTLQITRDKGFKIFITLPKAQNGSAVSSDYSVFPANASTAGDMEENI